MGTRIRYIKDGDTLVSSRYIETDKGEARVIIHTDNLVGNIEYGSPVAVEQVTGSSLHRIKMAVKQKLIELGAAFEEEKRSKSTIE